MTDCMNYDVADQLRLESIFKLIKYLHTPLYIQNAAEESSLNAVVLPIVTFIKS